MKYNNAFSLLCQFFLKGLRSWSPEGLRPDDGGPEGTGMLDFLLQFNLLEKFSILGGGRQLIMNGGKPDLHLTGTDYGKGMCLVFDCNSLQQFTKLGLI